MTLEVSPVQAEHLIYAAHEGRLQLALRAPGDDVKVTTRSIGVSDLLDDRSPRKAKKAVASAPSGLKIVRGTKVDVEKF